MSAVLAVRHRAGISEQSEPLYAVPLRRPSSVRDDRKGPARYGPAMTTVDAGVATETPAVAGVPLRMLRSEGLVLLAAAVAAYFTGLDEPWWLVPLVLFVPDVFMIGYARSQRLGAWIYNFAHSYPAPAALGAVAVLLDASLWQGVALVWFAHIGMDRALGYGLKYDTDFKDTHLGRIGENRRTA